MYVCVRRHFLQNKIVLIIIQRKTTHKELPHTFIYAQKNLCRCCKTKFEPMSCCSFYFLMSEVKHKTLHLFFNNGSTGSAVIERELIDVLFKLCGSNSNSSKFLNTEPKKECSWHKGNSITIIFLF